MPRLLAIGWVIAPALRPRRSPTVVAALAMTALVVATLVGLMPGAVLAQSAGASGVNGSNGTNGTGGSGGSSGSLGQDGIGAGGGGGGGGGTGGAGNSAGLSGGGGGGGGGGGSFTGAGTSFSNSGIVTGGTGGSGGGGGMGAGTNSVSPPPPAGGGGQGGGGGIGGSGLSFVGNGAVVTNSANVSGGDGGGGGAGGTGGPKFFGTAGRGGNGGLGGNSGVGVSITATDTTFINSASITGGNGGAGGRGGTAGYQGYIGGSNSYGQGGDGGNGGGGGVGLSFAGTDNTFVNSGVVAGGNGGAGGSGGIGGYASSSALNAVPGVNGAGGSAGLGGVGIMGASLTITNTGTISGGLANAGAGARAFAIVLTGGANYVGGNGQIIGGIDVQNAASFMPAVPGSMIGTQPLAITGPLMFASTSTYNIRISPVGNDRTNVTGTATLGGANVNVQANTFGVYRASTRTILTASTVAGTFNTVSTNLAFLNPTLSYDANNVFLTISGGGTFVIPGLTPNERNLAAVLTQVALQGTSGPGNQIIDALNNVPSQQAPAALDSLAGEGIIAAQNVANRSAQLFNGAIFDQTTFYGSGGAGNQVTLTDAPPAFVALAPEETLANANRGQPIRELADLPSSHIAPTFVAPNRTWRAWASGFGGVEDIHGNGAIGSATQNNTIYGGTLGVDYQLTPNYLVGLALGGSDGEFSVPGRTTSGSTTGGHVAVYDLATFGKFYGASSNSFSYYDNKTTRSVAGFGGLGGETERGDFNSHEFRTRLEFGRHIDIAGTTLTPFVALEIADLRSNGFGETSISGPGLFRLNVSGQSTADVPGYLGARVQTVMPLGGMTFLPSLQMAWEHEFAPYRSQIGAIADLPGSTFLVTGAQPARDAAQVKAGGELRIGANSALFANFDGEFSGVNQLYAGKGGFKYLW